MSPASVAHHRRRESRPPPGQISYGEHEPQTSVSHKGSVRTAPPRCLEERGPRRSEAAGQPASRCTRATRDASTGHATPHSQPETQGEGDPPPPAPAGLCPVAGGRRRQEMGDSRVRPSARGSARDKPSSLHDADSPIGHQRWTDLAARGRRCCRRLRLWTGLVDCGRRWCKSFGRRSVS
jgi:hypothetical protein